MDPGDLHTVLARVPKVIDDNLLVGTETKDDASVYQLSADLAIINTADYFTPIVDDPYTFGAIAATNALSDVYSMGGIPKTALNIVCWNDDQLDLEILSEILSGGADKVQQAGGVVAGGHTVTGPELLYGLALTGTIHPDQVVRNCGAQPGDLLILTKRLGIGIVTTGLKFDQVSEAVLPTVVESMTRLNQNASEIMLQHEATACTDITGYGLLGHAEEMASGNQVSIEVFSHQVPYFDQVPDLVRQGVATRAFQANQRFLRNKVSFDNSVGPICRQILMEAETSGGLLFAVPENQAQIAVDKLQQTDCPEAAIVGQVKTDSELTDGFTIQVV